MKERRFTNRFQICSYVLCTTLGLFGAFLLSISFASEAFAFESAKFAIEELCGHMEGALGALLMSAAAVGGIAAAAFGNFRASFSFIITGIGAFTVSALLSLYFPDAADSCTGEGANQQQQQQNNDQGQQNNAPNNNNFFDGED